MTTLDGLSKRMPSLFLAHGAPPLLDDAGWVRELGAWAEALPKPRAIVMISAHWEEKPFAIGATRPAPLIYDFYGFPERFYQIQYPSPGAPEVAAELRDLLKGAGQSFIESPDRGLDHGSYVPLLCMYPKADVPVLGVSIPTQDPKALYAIGEVMEPLRDRGVLIVGSGFLTHNLRTFRMGARGTPAWATDLDGWCKDVIAKRDLDALFDYKARAPGVREALPTHEHFVPLFVAMGASDKSRGAVSFPIEGFWFGSFTRRSVELA